MNVLKQIVVAGLSTAMAQMAVAETVKESAVRKLIQARLGAQVNVESVTKTPYAQLYEVRTNGEIIYTDELAKYLVTGQVIDAKTHRNYTEVRLEEINRVNFSDLPFDAAVKQVRGNGKRVIAIFEDPNCGYCKRFRQTLQDVDNVTVYTFLLNMLADDSATKSKNIWCSPDRAKALDEWMLNGKLPAEAQKSCATPNETVLTLGKKLRVPGTPTIIFSDGSRAQGAMDKTTLESKLAAIR